jgi:ribosomal protein S18 acetylase RimI-like enzyme
VSAGSTGSVRVRPAGPEDGEAVARLGEVVALQPLLCRYGVTAAGLGAELRRLATDQGEQSGQAGPDAATRLLLAEAEGLCGFARFQVRGTLGAGGYLQLIALAPGAEGRGVGAALLAAVEDEVRRHSPALFLLTSDFNEGAQRFYERHGYQRAGSLPDFARPGITEHIFWKRLR